MISAITDILIYFSQNSKFNFPYGEDGLAGLIDQARAGQEVEITLVSWIWTPQYTPKREALRLSLDGGWGYSFGEWLLDNGKRREGTESAELRDPVTGRLSNMDFITRLSKTGKAVELTRRQDEARGEVTVNNWILWTSGGIEGFLPLATVDFVDADVGEMSIMEQRRSRGPGFLSVQCNVLVGKKIIILPGLELPQVN